MKFVKLKVKSANPTIDDDLRKVVSKYPNIIRKEKPYHLKIRSTNPSLNEVEDLFLTDKEFERLKKLLLINTAWGR